jgi:hypothetical protein
MTKAGWEACFMVDDDFVGFLPTIRATVGPSVQWWQNVTIPNRWGGKIRTGKPDFCLMIAGCLHWIECKQQTGSGAVIGRLVATKDATGTDKGTGAGVEPDQAAWMDAATKAGATCWVAIRLEVNAATLRKAAQQPLIGAGGDLPAVVCRLVPWPEWRARMAAAEDCRRRGQEPQASIPAAELALMGWPLRSAGELLKALEAT